MINKNVKNLIEILSSVLLQISNNLFNWILIFFIIKNNGLESLYPFIYISSINLVLSILSNFGLDEYIFIKSSKLKKNVLPILRSLFVLLLFTSLFFYTITSVYFFYFDSELFVIFIIYGVNLVIEKFNIITNYLIAIKKFRLILIIRYLSISIFIILIFIFEKLDNEKIYLIFTIVNFISFSILYLIFLKKVNFKTQFLRKIVFKYYKVLISNLISSFNGRSIIIILDFFLLPKLISIYGLATRIIETVNLVSSYAIKTYTYDIIKDQHIKYLIFFNKKNIYIILANFLLFIVFIKFLEFNDKKLFTITNIFLIIYLCLYSSYFKCSEHLIKNDLVNKSKTYLFLNIVIVSMIFRLFLYLGLIYIYDFIGLIIAYFICLHTIYLLNYKENKLIL